MTREQAIVLGFIAAAFLAGWAAAALTVAAGRRARRRRSAERPLAEEVAEALQDDAANATMLSVFNGAGSLGDSDLDLADWGFTYGVAYARARDQAGSRPPQETAAVALRSADEVFRAYTAEAGSRELLDD